MRPITTAAVLALLALPAAAAPPARADLVIWGGPIYTAVDAHPTAPAVAVTGGRISSIGERELTLNLEGAKSAAEVRERLAAYIAELHPKGAVIGRGWIETGWPEHRFLERGDIDPVSADIPVILTRADGHALTANSAA